MTDEGRRSGIVRFVPYAVVALVLAGVAAALVLLGGDNQPSQPNVEPSALVVTAKGGGKKLGLTATAQGHTILSAKGLVPGDSATSRVKLRNRSTYRLKTRLLRRRIVDVPGPNGGKLSDVLQLRLTQFRRKGRSGRAKVIYSGRLANLRKVKVKGLKPNAKRQYEFTVTMPDTGVPPSATTGDNAYQGSTANAYFLWQGVAAP